MNRPTRLAAPLVLLAALAGCSDNGGPPSAEDPREGRVTITWSNCATGSCIYDWKICVGPDLHLHIDREDFVIEGSEECAP